MCAAPASMVITDSPAAGSAVVRITARRFRESADSETGDRDLFQRWFQVHAPNRPAEISKAVAAETNTSRTIILAQVPKIWEPKSTGRRAIRSIASTRGRAKLS